MNEEYNNFESTRAYASPLTTVNSIHKTYHSQLVKK